MPQEAGMPLYSLFTLPRYSTPRSVGTFIATRLSSMKKEDIFLGDWERILLGEAPAGFLLEVFIRSILTYVILLAVLKLLGKRMSGRLTSTEMSVMLMFGAVVSSAMQIPDRGIIESCYVLFLILLIQRLFTRWTTRRKTAEQAAQGTITMLVKDGAIQPGGMQKEILSTNQLFRILRAKSIMHLGEIKRVYMETNGSFSIIKNKKEKPGLPVMPKIDSKLDTLFDKSPDTIACKFCGTTAGQELQGDRCPNCSFHEWRPAVTKREPQ